jgi:hypothetical protein
LDEAGFGFSCFVIYFAAAQEEHVRASCFGGVDVNELGTGLMLLKIELRSGDFGGFRVSW